MIRDEDMEEAISQQFDALCALDVRRKDDQEETRFILRQLDEWFCGWLRDRFVLSPRLQELHIFAMQFLLAKAKYAP
jgi:hypothetical protein